MIKKTIKYTDFNGSEVSEDFYFHLSEAELIDMEIENKGRTLSKYIEDITREEDVREVIQTFKRIILMAYGQKSPDGRVFSKSDALRQEFAQTAAFQTLYANFIKDPADGAEFVKGIVPKSLQQAVDQDKPTGPPVPTQNV